MNEIEKLVAGFGRFQQRYYQRERQLFEPLVRQGQSPKVMIIACCDSRVDPAIITDCDPGDLFVVRNVANLVPPYETGGSYHGTSAALEFAVRTLRVAHVVVLGHSQCGGIRALVDGTGERGGFIAPWMEIAASARDAVAARLPDASPEEHVCAVEQGGIQVSLANLRTFPWIAQAVERGELRLHGWYFDIKAGALLRYDETIDAFRPLTAEAGAIESRA